MRINPELIEKYKGYAYMYAQYPNASIWSEKIKEEDLKKAFKQLHFYKPNIPAMLYVHIAFCPQICNYCSCFKIGTTDYGKVQDHLKFLLKEIDLLKKYLEEESINPEFKLVHLGGGSPTYLRNEDFNKLIEKINSIAPIEKLEEFAIEIDPRQVNEERMKYFYEKGINRISFGVQDFDLNVQKAVNRVQPIELTKRLLVPEIRKYFPSVSFDILHGLPKQTRETFRKTINNVLELSPDRVVLLTFNYSPDSHSNQKEIDPKELPNNLEKVEMFEDACETLLKNGYVRVGLEHFVKPTDKLVELWKTGNTNWNMSGYSPGNANKIIGVGLGSCSRITENYYFQNTTSLSKYEELISQGKFPLEKGWKLSEDDKIRRYVTTNLRSNFYLDIEKIEEKYKIDFRNYFKSEMQRLRGFIDDGIIDISNNTIKLTKEGLPFVSFVCMNFDAYT